MRISEPGRAPRPMYVTPVAALVLGLLLGGAIGAGLFMVFGSQPLTEKCQETIRTADQLLEIDERLQMFYIASIRPDQENSVKLRLERNALNKDYDAIRGKCDV